MEAFFPCLAKIFTPIALLCLACWALIGFAAIHAGADMALSIWLRRARAELQQIVGQYQPDYVPYQAMTLNKTLNLTRVALFYPALILILAMALACTVFFPSVFMSVARQSIESEAVSLSFRRAWLNPFTGTITLRNVKTSRSNDEHMDFDVEFDSVELDLRLLSATDPIHRYDLVALRKAQGSLVMINSVSKTIDPKDAVVIQTVKLDDFHVALADLTLHPAQGQSAPTINYDIQINQLVVSPFRTLHPAFDLMTNASGSGSLDGHPAQCVRSTDEKGTVVNMHFEAIDLAKFRYYLRNILPQLAGGTLDMDFTQTIKPDPAAKVQIDTKYTFRQIATQPVDKVPMNPKVFTKLNEFLASHRSEVQLDTQIQLDRNSYESAASFLSTGAASLQKKSFESKLMNMVLKETDLTTTPQGMQIEQIKSLIPPPNPSGSR